MKENTMPEDALKEKCSELKAILQISPFTPPQFYHTAAGVFESEYYGKSKAEVKEIINNRVKELFSGLSPDQVKEVFTYSNTAGYCTPLYYAACNDHIDVARYLLKNGAEVNVQDNINGFTPLHKAVIYNRAEMVKLLLEYGADVTATSKAQSIFSEPETPLDIAKKNNNTEIIRCLEEHINVPLPDVKVADGAVLGGMGGNSDSSSSHSASSRPPSPSFAGVEVNYGSAGRNIG